MKEITTKFPDVGISTAKGLDEVESSCSCNMCTMRNDCVGAFPALAALNAITQESKGSAVPLVNVGLIADAEL
jgi:hypothetical protein